MRGPYRTGAMVTAEPEWSLACGDDGDWDALSPVVAPARAQEFVFPPPRRAVVLIALAGVLGVVIGMTLGSSTQARPECADERSPIDCSE